MILGVVLAGGRSSRFGSDKALAELGGHTLLNRAFDTLTGFCELVVIAGRERGPGRCIPDWPASGAGPLGGLAAGLNYARDEGYATVLTCGVDSLGLPEDLLDLLSPAPAFVAQQPIVGHWPAEAAGAIEELLSSSRTHSVRAFADMIGARPVKLARDPANINTPADLAAAEKKYGI